MNIQKTELKGGKYMPVPKGKQELYGKVVGHMINSGKSLQESKNIADRAVKVKKSKKMNKKSKF